MFKKITFAAVAAVTAMAAIPATAEARPHGNAYGYYNNSAHARGYYNNGYAQRGFNDGYYGDRYYNGRAYSNNRYRRCSGTTGTIVGGVAGALLGRSATRDYRHSGTTGTILGGALGALAGNAIGKSSCRNR
jgi:hypothetical protein